MKLDPEYVFSTASAYYKRESFHPTVQVSIQFEGQPAIDAGGPRLHFLSRFLKDFATLPSLSLFEGPTNRLKPQNVVTGMFTMLGKILSHSLVLEGTGFPYLIPVRFEYLSCGLEDVAILQQYVCSEGVPPRLQHDTNLVSEFAGSIYVLAVAL